MRILSFPELNAMEVFDACVNSTGNHAIRSRLETGRTIVVEAYKNYIKLAESNNLYQIVPFDANDDTYVIGEATAKEFKNLYTQQLSVKSRPPRNYYDKILASAPRGKCPLCGLGQASTLDHFLSKAGFPVFSVLPANLIPACKDCNHGKGMKVATGEAEQGLHPYFGNVTSVREQWIFASIEQTIPASASYRADPPENWDPKLRQRVKRHFEDFDLARRYAVEASTEIAGLRPVLENLWNIAGQDSLKSHMDMIASSSLQHEPNSWKSALLQGLAASTWYWSGGFSAVG